MNSMNLRQTPLLLVPLLAMLGCTKVSRVSTHAAGHPVTLSVAGTHSIDEDDNRGVISSQYGRVTIERERVQLNDAPWTPIRENVPIDVRISKGTLSVAAGSTTTSVTVR